MTTISLPAHYDRIGDVVKKDIQKAYSVDANIRKNVCLRRCGEQEE